MLTAGEASRKGQRMGLHGAEVVLIAAKTATFGFGSVLTYLSYRAFRRTNSRALRALGVGIGLLTVGALVGGVLHRLVGVSLEVSVSVQSVFTAVGLGIMTYSLFTDVVRGSTRTRSGTRTGD
jgi:hypothetical protein